MTTDLERLRQRSLKEQWALDDLDWASIDFRALDDSFKRAGAVGIAQILAGERTALAAATRLLPHLPEAACAVGEIQVRDEERHVAFFERVLVKLGLDPDQVRSVDVGGLVRPSVAGLLADVRDAETPEAVALGMHLVVEGAGHALFASTGKVFAMLEGMEEYIAKHLDEVALASAVTVAGDWMPRLLGRDEGRHIALGLAFLHERLPRLSAADTARLEECVGRWGDVVVGCAREPDVVEQLGFTALPNWSAGIVEELNRRVSQAGLETRLPPPEVH